MKQVVVTGAASGIGKAVTEAYLAQGDRVIGIDFNQDLGQAMLKEHAERLEFLFADLSSVVDCERIADELKAKTIDVLIHSAGINHTRPFLSSDINVQKKVLDINLRAPILLTQKLLASETIQEGASIVFVSSLSHQLSYPSATVYAASKDGLTSFARSLSVILAGKQHVLTVFPGPTRTPHAREHSPDNSREEKRMSPELLAQKILTAIKRKQSRLVPSFSLRVFAFIGTFLPFITEQIMIKSLYNKLKD